MDEMKGKFKSLFSKAQNQVARATGSNFKGSGHRLGTAEEHPASNRQVAQNAAAAAARTQPPTSTSSVAGRPSSAAGRPLPQATTSSSSSSSSRPQAPARSTAAGGASSTSQPVVGALKPATEFDGFTPVIGAGAALNSMQLQPPAASPSRTQHTPPSPTPASGAAAAAAAAGPPAPSSEQAAAAAAALLEGCPLSPSSGPSQAITAAVEVLLGAAIEEGHSGGAAAAAAGGGGRTALETAAKLLGNLVAVPQEPRYRQLRLSNPGLRRRLLGVPGGLDLLAAAGWEVHGEEEPQQQQQGQAGSSGVAGAAAEGSLPLPADGFAVFLHDSSLPRAAAAYQQLTAALDLLAEADAAAASTGATQPPPAAAEAGGPCVTTAAASAPAAAGLAAAGTGAAAAAASSASPAQPAPAPPSPAAAGGPAIQRVTRVLLPVTPQVEVPDWFFDRTPADLKLEYVRLTAARAEGQLFKLRPKGPPSTSPEQEAAAAAGKVATVRVRFPEGVLLEGRFGGREPAAAVHTWVSECLDPVTGAGAMFDLVLPDRRPLGMGGSVAAAGLLPAVLLNFRRTDVAPGAAGGSSGRQQSLLAHHLRQRAECDCSAEL